MSAADAQALAYALEVGAADLADARSWADNQSVTFSFFTQAQLRANETSGTRERSTQAYAQLIAPHDEFGYLAKRGIAVYFNSKENFDTVYKGNWFYYDKDH